MTLSATAVPARAVASDDANPLLKAYEAHNRDEDVDISLVVDVLEHICIAMSSRHAATGHAGADMGGAILVFLPGWDEISKVKDELAHHRVGTAGVPHKSGTY